MKKIYFALIFFIICGLKFCPNSAIFSMAKISPHNEVYMYDSYQNNYIKDTTQIVLHYKSKEWTYNAKDFQKHSQQFDIEYKLNKYKLNNNKNKKINTINKLLKLNFDKKIIINYIFPSFDEKINKINRIIEKQSKNAYFIYNKELKIIDEIIGEKINYENLYSQILENYLTSNIIDINIPITKIYPEITTKDLAKSKYLRGEFSTTFYNSSLDRKHNIKQALRKINSIKLAPKNKFSFNSVVGKRNKENGFRIAKIIKNGEFVDGLGGGVCQVSSTLYNAVLLSGLEVNSANKHSEKVGYIKTGFDAMVNFGSSDFCFTNNTSNDIYIFTEYQDGLMKIKIYGEKCEFDYKLTNEISNIIPCGEKEVIVDYEKKYIDKVQYSDESFVLKKSRDGFTVKSYREKYKNDKLIGKELLRTDKYLPQNEIKIVGSEEKPISIFG